MERPRIAIACQGGGSQTAFTAGVLKALFEAGIERDFRLVSLSGTSGGAVCAALIWYALQRKEQPVWTRLMRFWAENTAQTTEEKFFNDVFIEWVRMVNRGMLPGYQISPASDLARSMIGLATMGHRKPFADFRTLLAGHIDFAETEAWGPRAERPVLVMGAASVLSGQLHKFISSQVPLRVEQILASCAVPNIFPAVEADGDAYWDGLFSDNPPISVLTRPAHVGEGNIPHEIWLVKINPTTRASIPVQADDILDRRNQLEGNVSLFQQLHQLEFINDLIILKAFKQEFLERFDVHRPVRIPKAFAGLPDRPYHIPCIEMSEAMQQSLDYEGKIDRGERNIRTLIAHGEEQARAFLEARRRMTPS